jgi:hypothetical protein
MQGKLEGIIKRVYQSWRLKQPKVCQPHPQEEELACLLEGRLGEEEAKQIKAHLVGCQECAQAFALNLGLGPQGNQEVPEKLLERIREAVIPQDKSLALEIILRLKEKALEIINTTGDVLVGQELVPASILRSRSIKDFADEVTILKDFGDMRVEIKIENKGAHFFDVIITVKNKNTQEPLKDLRVTLIKDDLELESYLAGSGAIVFEHVMLGRYNLRLSSLQDNLASILLDIRA